MKHMATIAFSVLIGSSLIGVAQEQVRSASLCELQKNVLEGNHQPVRVSGIYLRGYERSVLTASCSNNEGTWVEFELKSKHNRDELSSMLNGKGNEAALFS
jgi:hypothetical protein